MILAAGSPKPAPPPKPEKAEPTRPRGRLRAACGQALYGTLRRLLWLLRASRFAKERAQPLPYLHARHSTPLIRELQGAEKELQRNKVRNLRLAAASLSGVVVRPGQVFSYWRLVGNPCRRRGFVEGMVLKNGRVQAGVGGGLCQMSNLIFWMALHTPLTVLERHRHGYDVFPDSGRTQPFGSGATCFYPHGDLMLRNDTPWNFQLQVHVGRERLHGQWRCTAPAEHAYRIVERNHRFRSQPWGGYIRHNELMRQVFDLSGRLLGEELAVINDAVAMYSPLLAAPKDPSPAPPAAPPAPSFESNG